MSPERSVELVRGTALALRMAGVPAGGVAGSAPVAW